MNRLEVMQAAAREAGQFMVGAAEMNQSTEKNGAKDFVTVADIKSQDMVRAKLKEYFPNDVVLSEEDSEQERQALYAEDFTGFVIDPIDGTYNFKRDMRESCVSIGYIENGESTVGVVYDPYRNELYTAEQGKGAYRNGQSIRVSDQSELRGASVGTSNGYDDEAALRDLKRQIAIYEQTGIMPWTTLPGSFVLAMVWIACGRMDAVHHNGTKPWDNAAAFLIVREAGGKTLTLTGEQAKFTDSCVLVGTSAIVDQMNQIFSTLSSELLK